VFNNFFFENRAVYEIRNMEKHGSVGQATDDNTTRLMCIACWLTKAIDTHSEYVILFAFPQEKWLQERASMLLYT
jgi:hypothetical protein